MLKDEKKLWVKLNEFEISRLEFDISNVNQILGDFSETTGFKFIKNLETNEEKILNFKFIDILHNFISMNSFYSHFAVGINRAISFYSEIIKLQNPKDYFNVKMIFIFNSIYILAINALEVYLGETFQEISNKIMIDQLDLNLFVKFLKEFNLNKNFLSKLAEKNTLMFSLSEILPDRLDFQQKEKTKIGYKLTRLKIDTFDNQLWERIFSKESGYITKRNKIVHSGPNELIEGENINDFNLDEKIEEIENLILDIVEFIYFIEIQRFFNYPDLSEKSKIYNFPQLKLAPDLKKKIIEINFETLLNRTQEIFDNESYDKSMEFLNLLKDIRPNDMNLNNIYKRFLNLDKKTEDHE